jgi:hypothetical protein
MIIMYILYYILAFKISILLGWYRNIYRPFYLRKHNTEVPHL